MEQRCSEIQDLLAAYSLDALDAKDRRMVDIHLDSCVDCQQSLAEYQQVTDGLLLSAPSVEPPARLRAKLIHEIAKGQGVQTPKRRWSDIPLRNLAGALALGLLLVLNASLLIQTRALSQQQTNLIASIEEDRTVLGLTSYPEARMVSLIGEQAYGTLIYEPELDVAVLYAWGLADLENQQTYQAWLIKSDGDRVNGGLFQMEGEEGFARLIIHSPEALDTYAGVGVTIEPAGGSLGPTGPKVLGVEL